MQKNLKKIAILLIVIALTILLALDVSDNNPLPTVKDLQMNRKDSATGAYLAGQYAARQSDYGKASKFFLDSIKYNKNNPELDENVLDLLIATGDYDAAIELAEKIQNNDSNNSAKLMLFADKMRNADYAAAKKLFESLADDTTKMTITNLLRAWANIGLGNNKTALEDVSKIERGDYLENIINFNHALIAEIAGEDDIASKYYKLLLENNKPTKRIAQNAYRFFKNSGDLESAKILFAVVNEGIDLKTLQKISSAKTASAYIFSDLAGMLLMEQNFAQSAMYYRLSLHIEPDNEDTILLLGAILAHERDYEASNKVFDMIPETSENYNPARMAKTQNLIGMENDAAAANLLEELANDEDSKIEASVSLGDIERKKENFAASNQYYTDAIEASVDEKIQQVYWPIYFARGVTFERMKDWEAAEADFHKALELQPKQPDVLNYLAYSLLDMNFEERFEEALNMLEIAYQQRPNDPHIIDSIGWAWFKMEDYEKATKHLERAAEKMPYDPTINEHLGDIYWKSGRRNEALFAWKRALENEPEERFLEQLKHKIANGMVEDEPAEKVETDENINHSAS